MIGAETPPFPLLDLFAVPRAIYITENEGAEGFMLQPSGVLSKEDDWKLWTCPFSF
jgi:hypothetical protein